MKPRVPGIKQLPASQAHRYGHGDILGWREEAAPAPAPSGSKSARSASSGGRDSPSLPPSSGPSLSVVAQGYGTGTGTAPTAAPFPGPADNVAVARSRPSSASGGGSASAAAVGPATASCSSSTASAAAAAPAPAFPGSRPGTAASAAAAGPRSPADVCADAVASRHNVFMRAMTSRLAELRELCLLWQDDSGRAGSSYRRYLATLRLMRDRCHEWSALDVLKALNTCNGVLYADADDVAAAGGDDHGDEEAEQGDEDEQGADGGRQVRLHGGIPCWWPSTRGPSPVAWSRLLCPVLESLLYSCYEDYLLVGCECMRKLIEATQPVFETAAALEVDDLAPPRPLDETGLEGEDGHAEDEDEGTEAEAEGKAGEEARQQLQLQRREALLRHRTALDAVDLVRQTFPLLTALASAAGNPGAVYKLATQRARRLAEMHHTVRHLTQAASASVG